MDIVPGSRKSVSRCLAAEEDDYELQMIGYEVRTDKSKSFKSRSKLNTVAGTEIIKANISTKWSKVLAY